MGAQTTTSALVPFWVLYCLDVPLLQTKPFADNLLCFFVFVLFGDAAPTPIESSANQCAGSITLLLERDNHHNNFDAAPTVVHHVGW